MKQSQKRSEGSVKGRAGKTSQHGASTGADACLADVLLTALVLQKAVEHLLALAEDLGHLAVQLFLLLARLGLCGAVSSLHTRHTPRNAKCTKEG